ncbi:hypothetical protein RUM44_004666 [Polyplax serrata]|uniref:Breast cancer metastasis-suppressor 1-like protein n=1 Tax=Polyplax serrata TaxID=468196 RepID=A0ABR1B3H5_POLSC
MDMGRKPGKSRHLSSPRRKNRGENLRLWRERERMTVIKLDRNQGDDSDVEEMDHDSNDSDKSSSNSDSSDGSDYDDSSEMDEEECERLRSEYVEDLVDLERQFTFLREQLYRERFTQVDSKLLEIRSGRAQEYLQPLQQLQENMRIRTEVAAILKQFSLASVNNQIDAEAIAAVQNLQSEQKLLWDTIQDGLEGEIRRLEEDRNNIDVSSALWGSEQPRRTSGSRRKPVSVNGPYIIYMLHESDILEDWTIIKRALTVCKRKTELH